MQLPVFFFDQRRKKSRKQRETAENPKMGQDFFTYLPSEMIMNILLRLPIRSIIRCRFVCKSWLDLLATPEFVKSHLSKSVAGLALFVYGNWRKPYKFFEFVDEINLNRRVLRWKTDTVFNFNLPCAEPLHSSANGLLFLCREGQKHRDLSRLQLHGFMMPRNLFICNPVTRDYITIPCPHESSFSKDQLQLDTYGFGVSRMSGQYKLVRMFHEWIQGTRVPMKFAESECQVYTVGTGSWKRIGSGGQLLFYAGGGDVGVFLNGNLHWLTLEREGSSLWISCFDLETELFSTFSSPLLHSNDTCSRELSALGECLCLCDSSDDDEIVIWLMKEYGGDKSWTKEFIISKRSPMISGYIRPIKIFEKGGILMVSEAGSRVLYFTSKTIRIFDLFQNLKFDYSIHAIMYTPSFVSLKTFAMENVTSF